MGKSIGFPVLVFVTLPSLRSEGKRKERFLNKRQEEATSHRQAASWFPAGTCVSVALVRVHGQVGEVRAGVLVQWSGHN